MKQTISILFLLFFLIGTSAAQEKPNGKPGVSSSEQKGWKWISGKQRDIHELSLWGGYAFDSIRLWGKITDSTLGQYGIRYNRKTAMLFTHLLEYTFELYLHSRYTYPYGKENQVAQKRLSGYGFSPLGFQINFFTEEKIQPFFKSSGGFMWLEAPFPDERGKKFNFTFGVGGGIETQLAPYASLTLGYRYFHLSNFHRGEVNPGVDSSFFYGGLTFAL